MRPSAVSVFANEVHGIGHSLRPHRQNRRRAAQPLERRVTRADVETLRLAQLDDRLLRDAAVAPLGFAPKLGVEVVRKVADLQDGHLTYPNALCMHYACARSQFKGRMSPPSVRTRRIRHIGWASAHRLPAIRKKRWAKAHPIF